jgi:hypothetical protein
VKCVRQYYCRFRILISYSEGRVLEISCLFRFSSAPTDHHRLISWHSQLHLQGTLLLNAMQPMHTERTSDKLIPDKIIRRLKEEKSQLTNISATGKIRNYKYLHSLTILNRSIASTLKSHLPEIRLISILPSVLSSANGGLLSDSPPEILYAFLVSHMPNLW